MAATRSTSSKSEPRPSRLQVDERRAQLIALGVEIFNKRPYDEIAIEDIAAAAGISKGLLYHYFRSKKAFYIETVRAGTTEISMLTDEPDDGRPPNERLRAGVEKYLAFVEARPRGYVHVLRSGVGFDPEVAKMIEKTRRIMAKRILDGLGLVDADPLLVLAVHGWVGFVEATTVNWVEKKTVERSALAELLTNMVQATVMAATAQADRSPATPQPSTKTEPTTKKPRARKG